MRNIKSLHYERVVCEKLHLIDYPLTKHLFMQIIQRNVWLVEVTNVQQTQVLTVKSEFDRKNLTTENNIKRNILDEDGNNPAAAAWDP